jgi:hypothetical protein
VEGAATRADARLHCLVLSGEGPHGIVEEQFTPPSRSRAEFVRLLLAAMPAVLGVKLLTA